MEDPSFSAGFLQSGLFFVPGCYLLLFFVSFGSLGHSSGQIVSGRVVFWTFVGRPCTLAYAAGSVNPKIGKCFVPMHSCESKTSLSSFQ